VIDSTQYEPKGYTYGGRFVGWVAGDRSRRRDLIIVRQPQGWVPWQFTSAMHAKTKCRRWQDCTSRRLMRPTGADIVGGRCTNFARTSGARHMQQRTEASFALSSKMTPASWSALRRVRCTMVGCRDSSASRTRSTCCGASIARVSADSCYAMWLVGSLSVASRRCSSSVRRRIRPTASMRPSERSGFIALLANSTVLMVGATCSCWQLDVVARDLGRVAV